jgi:hypothetical protein
MPPTDPKRGWTWPRCWLSGLYRQSARPAAIGPQTVQDGSPAFSAQCRLGERIADLEQGKDTSLWTGMWTMMFPRNTRCAREGEAGHVHDHDTSMVMTMT